MLRLGALLLLSTASALAPESVTSAAASPSANFAKGRELAGVHYHGAYGTGSTYGQRNQNSWIGFLVGIALLGIAPLLLVMTELQGVKITRLIGRAQASTLANIPSAEINPSLDGFMVHTTGPLSVAEDGSGAYTDKGTGVCFGSGAFHSAQVNSGNFAFQVRGAVGAKQPLVPSHPLRVKRTVEVYQWVEREQQDANTTDYIYETHWLEIDVSSNDFKMQAHQNPRQRVVDLKSSSTDRSGACLGAFSLCDEAITKCDWWAPAHVHESTGLDDALKAKNARIVHMPDATEGGCMGIFVPSGHPPVDQFAVGDMRITYQTVELPATPATAVGVQAGSQLRPYTKQDAARVMGRSTPRDGADDLNEADAEELRAMINGTGPPPNCCKVFAVLSSLFAKLLLMVMRHVVGTEVLLMSPLAKSATGMFFSENLRVEKALTTFRVVGTVLFILAFYLILHPIAALFSFIPFLGKLISSLFLVAAIIVGFSCALFTVVASWLVVKPLRACLGFAFIAGLYSLELYFEPMAAAAPIYTFGVLSVVAGALALWELYNDCKFQAAAKAGKASASYVQVGLPVIKPAGGTSAHKEMV